MANEDFFVRFGSNLPTFAADLERDKIKVAQAINDIKNLIAAGEKSIGGTSLGAALMGGRRTAAPPPPTPATPVTNGGARLPQIDPNAIALVNTELSKLAGNLDQTLSIVTNKLFSAATRADRTAATLEQVALQMKGLPGRESRSDGARGRVEKGEVRTYAPGTVYPPGWTNKRGQDMSGKPAGGQTVAQDKVIPGAQTRIMPTRARDEVTDTLKGLLDDAPRPSARDVPTSMIDEAQLARIIEASRTTAKNTGKTNDRLDRVIAAINDQTKKIGTAPAAPVSATTRTTTTPTTTTTTTTPAAARTAGTVGGEPKPSKALNKEINTVKARIEERERLSAVQSELNRAQRNMATGPNGRPVRQQDPNPDILGRAARGSATFEKTFDRTGGQGQEYIDYLANVRKSLQDGVKGIPNLKALRGRLAELEEEALQAPPKKRKAETTPQAPRQTTPPVETPRAAAVAGKAPAPGPRLSPEEDALFKRVNQVKEQIKTRERLAELLKARDRLAAGQDADAGDLNTRAKLQLSRFAVDNPMSGEKVTARINNAIEAAQAEVAKWELPVGLSPEAGLNFQLNEAIRATGTPDGKRPKGTRRPAKEEQPLAEPATPTGTPEDTQAKEKAAKEKAKAAQRKRIEALEGQVRAYEKAIATANHVTTLVNAELAKTDLTPERRTDLSTQLAGVIADREDSEADLAKAQASLERAYKKEAGITREDERNLDNTVRKTKARARAAGLGGGLTRKQGMDKLARLDIAGDKGNLEDLSAKQLFGLVEDYREQGYALPQVGVRNELGEIPRTRRGTMINQLSEANRLMATGEQETLQGLEQYRGKRTPRLKGAALKATERLLGTVAEEVDASLNSLRTQDYAGGGSGLTKGRRGKTDIAFGSELQPTGTPGGITRERIIEAQDSGKVRIDRINEAARRDAARQISQYPDFNPYHEDLDVKGGARGSEAANVRMAVNALRRASTEIDKLARAANHAQGELEEMDAREDRLAGINDRLRDLRTTELQSGRLNKGERKEWERLVEQRERVIPRVAQDRERRGDVEKTRAKAYQDVRNLTGTNIQDGFFATPEALQGLSIREQGRIVNEDRIEQMRLRQSDPTRMSVEEAAQAFRDERFGRQNVSGVGSGTSRQGQSKVTKRTESTALLTNVQNEEAFSREFPQYVRADLKRAQKMERRLFKAEKALLQMTEDNRLAAKRGEDPKYDETALQSQRQLMAQRRSDFLTSYEEATGPEGAGRIRLPTRVTAADVEARRAENKVRTDAGEEPLPELVRTFGKGDKARFIKAVNKQVAEREKALAEALERDAQEGRNLIDPRTVLRRDERGRTVLENLTDPRKGDAPPDARPRPSLISRPATEEEAEKIRNSPRGKRVDALEAEAARAAAALADLQDPSTRLAEAARRQEAAQTRVQAALRAYQAAFDKARAEVAAKRAADPRIMAARARAERSGPEALEAWDRENERVIHLRARRAARRGPEGVELGAAQQEVAAAQTGDTSDYFGARAARFAHRATYLTDDLHGYPAGAAERDGFLSARASAQRAASLSPEEVVADLQREAAEARTRAYTKQVVDPSKPYVAPDPDVRPERQLSKDEQNAQLARAREELKKSGIRTSSVMNQALHDAQDLPALIDALETAIKRGTLVFSQYLGDPREARKASGKDSYQLGTSTLPAPTDTEGTRPGFLGEGSAAQAAEAVLDEARRIQTQTGIHIGERDVPKQAREASPEPEVLNKSFDELFGESARKTVQADNTKVASGKRVATASEAVAKQLAAAERAIASNASDRRINMVRGSLANAAGGVAAGFNQADYRGGVEGLQRLVNDVRAGASTVPVVAPETPKAAAQDALATAQTRGGFDDDCCTKIVEAINRVTATLKGGLRLTASGQVAAQVEKAQRQPKAAQPAEATQTPVSTGRKITVPQWDYDARAAALDDMRKRQARDTALLARVDPTQATPENSARITRTAEESAARAAEITRLEAELAGLKRSKAKRQPKPPEPTPAVPVTVTTPTTTAPTPDSLVQDANTARLKAQQYQPMSTRAVREFEAGIPDEPRLNDLRQQMGTKTRKISGVDEEVANAQAVELATSLVTREYANQAQAAAYLRQALGLTEQAHKDLILQLRASVAGARLAAGTQRGSEADRRRKINEDERARQDAKKAERKTNAENATQREAADQTRRLNSLMAGLSQEAQNLLAALRAAQQSGAPAAEINDRQRAFYERAAREMATRTLAAGDDPMSGLNKGQRQRDIGLLMSSRDVGMGVSLNQNEIRRVGADAETMLRAELMRAASANQGEMGGFWDMMFGGKGFMGRVVNSIGLFAVRNVAAGMVFGLTAALGDAIQQALETESTFVRVSGALEATGRSAGTLRSQLTEISTSSGVALKDVYTTAASLTGVFGSNEEIARATRVATNMETISRGALSATEAVKALASVSTAFGQTGVQGLEQVQDSMVAISDRMGVNIEDIIEGTGRLAGQANAMGFSLQETGTYVAAISKLTNQTGQAAGEQFQRIIAGAQTGRGQASLLDAFGTQSRLSKRDGIETGIEGALGERDYGAVFEIMLKNYSKLTAAQQSNLASALAGSRQAASFQALMAKSGQVLDTVAASTDAVGNANQRAKDIYAQLNNQLKILRQNFVNLIGLVERSGLLSGIGLLLGLFNKLLGITITFGARIADAFDSNPVTKFAKEAVGGVLGLVIAIRLLQVAMRSLRGVATQSGLFGPLDANGVPIERGGRRGLGIDDDDDDRRRPGRQNSLLSLVPFGSAERAEDRERERRENPEGRGRLRDFGRSLQATGGDLISTSVRPANVPFGPLTLADAERVSGADDDSRASRTRRGLGSALDAAGRTAESAGKGINRFTDAMRGSALAAISASVGLTALGLGLGAVIAEFMRNQRLAEDVAALAARRRKQRRDDLSTADQEADSEGVRNYEGPEQDLLKQTRKDAGGFMSESTRAAVRALSIRNLFTGFIPGMGGENNPDNKGLFGLAQSEREALGYLPGEEMPEEKGGPSIKQRLFGRDWNPFNDRGEQKERQRKFSVRSLNNLEGDLRERVEAAGLKGDIDALDEAGKKNAQVIADMADDITNSDLSDAQKANAAAKLAEVERKVAEAALVERRRIQGLSTLNIANQQQMDELAALSSALQNTGEVSMQFPDLVKFMGEDLGFKEGSDYERLVQNQTKPQSRLDRTRAIGEEQRLNLEGIQAQLADSNISTDLEDELKARVPALLSAYMQTVQSIIQMAIESSRAISEALAMGGDFAGAASALQGGIQELQVAENRARASGDETQAQIYENQRRGLEREQVDLNLEPQAMAERELRSRNRDPLVNASSERREAERVLNAYTEASANGVGPGVKEVSAARERYNNALRAEADAMTASRRANQQRDLAGMVNQMDRATQEEAIAAADVADALAQHGPTSAAYAEALGRQTQALLNTANIAEEIRAATAALDIQRIRNPLANANAQTAEARAVRDSLLARGYAADDPKVLAAERNVVASEQSASDTREATRAATAQTGIARIAPGDARRIAQARLDEARRAQSAATEFGTNSTQYQQATQQVIAAMREFDQALYDVAAANMDVNIAVAEAAGNKNQVAALQKQNADRLYAEALQRSGGNRNAPDVQRARAQQVRANANVRDTQLQSTLDTVDFQMEMGEITAGAAIRTLQDLLKQQNLTEEQRRNLRRKIKGLENAIDGQFNLGDIRVPTVYQVRKSIAQQAQQTATDTGMGMEGNALAQMRQNVANNIDNRTVNITVNGGDIAKVTAAVREAAGANNAARTTRSRKF